MFTDVHGHYISGVDDGAKNSKMSEHMLDIAYADGIRTIICTPHYHPTRGRTPHDEVVIRFEKLRNLAQRKYPDLRLIQANEVYYSGDCLEWLEQGIVTGFPDGKTVLIEFSPDEYAQNIVKAVYSLTRCGKQPLVAHIERYTCMLKEKNRIEELLDAGALIQVNAATLTGHSGFMTKHTILKWIKNGYIYAIGTDAHNDTTRVPKMRECYELIKRKCGEETAKALCCKNGLKLIR